MQMLQSKPKDVLLAEDDPEDFLLFQYAVKEITIPVLLRHAEDGDKLFEMLKEAIPDILFLDIHLPCKNGISCILEIRKNPQYNNMPVIMFTSYNHRSYVNQTYQSGANYYIVKPTSIQKLAEKLQQVLSIEWEKQLYFPPKHEFVLS
jgi:CheY-like chemotaxis protein